MMIKLLSGSCRKLRGGKKDGLDAREIIQMVLFLTSQIFLNHISKIPFWKARTNDTICFLIIGLEFTPGDSI